MRINGLDRDRRAWRPLVVAAAVALGVASPRPGRGEVELLADYIAQFARLSSVHLEADAAAVREFGKESLRGEGKLVYREQGQLYKLRCETDDALGLVDDLEWGYDGKQHRGWFLEQNIVTLNASEGKEAPTALLNPFFVALYFLFGRDAFAERIDLGDVRREGERLVAGAQEELSETERRLVVTNHAGSRTTMDLRLESGVWVPVRMLVDVQDADDSDAPDGLEIVLARFERSGGLLFPRTISMRRARPDGRVDISIEYTISRLEIDGAMPPESFAVTGNESSHFRLGPER